MKINSINNKYNLSFSRNLRPIEKIQSRAYIDEAKKAIGLNRMVLITHTPSLPSSKDEDVGIGVLSLNQGTKSYLNFAYNNGFDAISVEPSGIVKPPFYSPYDSSLLSKKMIVDLKELTTDKWANILDKDIFKKAVGSKNYTIDFFVSENGQYHNKGQKELSNDRVIYDYAIKVNNEALKSAFKNFKTKVANHDEKALEINEEYINFKKENDYYLTKDAIFNVLNNIYGSEYYPFWSKLHQTLFDNQDKTYSHLEKNEEINKLKEEYREDIELFKFSQFVVNKQQNELTEYASKIGEIQYKKDIQTVASALKKREITIGEYLYLVNKLTEFKNNKKGIKIIGDKQVGYSKNDIWSNPDLFTKDEYMGAPQNPSKGSIAQDWDFNFIPREKLFNADGSLAEGGEYLKKITKKAFEDNVGGLRIDHILGLIDPWTYEKSNNNSVSLPKFDYLLSGPLKELNNFGINSETVKGLKNPFDALVNPASDERKILIERGISDFDSVNKIINQNRDIIDSVKSSNAYDGSRYVFKYLLQNQLSELKECGITPESIKGVLDPIKGILDSNSKERYQLVQANAHDFLKAKKIILKNSSLIIEEYSKILKDIILKAGEEVITERAKKEGAELSEEEINKKTKELLICEDLGVETIPLKIVMKKFNLPGMRNTVNSHMKKESQTGNKINANKEGNYLLVGTHDSLPYEIELQKYDQQKLNKLTQYLSEDLGVDKKIITENKNLFDIVNAKIAELFTADKNPSTLNNVLINWLDLFAKKETYNVPGVLNNEINWNLRISDSNKNFEDEYYDKLVPQRRGINIPKALSMALKSYKLDDDYRYLAEKLDKTVKIMEE